MTTSAVSVDLAAIIRHLPNKPGVYRMLDKDGTVLYVGKAKALRKRVSSYFRPTHNSKTRALVSQIADIAITLTDRETEALRLEHNYIKKFRPRFNVLFRDDKSFPYIFISHHAFPRISFHRGSRRQKGHYFGPFPESTAVRDSLHLLQKLFRLRSCEDPYFNHRSRPCLQYQIKRCTAPCVGYISETQYQEDVRLARMVLEGKNETVIETLVQRMTQAAEQQEFELAAHYRNQLLQLRKVQESSVVVAGVTDTDVIVLAKESHHTCVHVLFVRGGKVVGDQSYWPEHADEAASEEILLAFITQYYLSGHTPPAEIVVGDVLPEQDKAALENMLQEIAERKIKLSDHVRGHRAEWIKLARTNAEQSLRQRASLTGRMDQRWQALQQRLNLPKSDLRVECFDISHTQGEGTVASCVVFDQQGARKSDYRRYHIHDVTPGDDYAAMRQALMRRYRKQTEQGEYPDIIMVDGGLGQLTQAEQVCAALGITQAVLVGVAKGVERQPGKERLFVSGLTEPLSLPSDDPALHLIQQVRDEAHRFAITGHRMRRARARQISVVEEIPGIGAKRRRDLLTHLGGAAAVMQAGVDELARVPGISHRLAHIIYEHFHGKASS